MIDWSKDAKESAMIFLLYNAIAREMALGWSSMQISASKLSV